MSSRRMICKKNDDIGKYSYDYSDILGHGAFAIVYKGQRSVEPYDKVAIKCVNKENSGKTKGLILKEINILNDLSKLKHQNIVALHECIHTFKHVYLIMEFCSGGDFNQYLSANKAPFSISSLSVFVKQLARGIRACYHMGIMHRDLKPQNILLDFQGKRYPPVEEITLKIADFGFARFIGEGAMAETMCGSPLYMAPEVIMSMKYSGTVDLFSLGTIIYQCFVRRYPFPTKSLSDLKMFYERSKGDWRVEFPDSCQNAPDLKDLLRKLLKNVEERISYEQFFDHPFVDLEPFEGVRRIHVLNNDEVSIEERGLMKSAAKQQIGNNARHYSDGDSPITKDNVKHLDKQGNLYQNYKGHMNTTTTTQRYSDVVKTDHMGMLVQDDFVIVPRNIPYGNDNKISIYRTSLKPNSPGMQVYGRIKEGQELHDILSNADGSVLNSLLTCNGNLSCGCDSCKVSDMLLVGELEKPKEVPELTSSYNTEMEEEVLTSTEEILRSRKISDTILPNIALMCPPTAISFGFDNMPSANVGSLSDLSDSENADYIGLENSNNRRQKHKINDDYIFCWYNFMLPPTSPSRKNNPVLYTEKVGREVQQFTKLSPIHYSMAQTKISSCSSEEIKLLSCISPTKSQQTPSATAKYKISYPENFNGVSSFPAPPSCHPSSREQFHFETLAKLQFINALIECITELAKSQDFFYTSLTIAPRRRSIFGDQKECQNEEWQRKTEQLALYIRAMHLISLAMHMAQIETMENRLKSSIEVEEAARSLTKHFNSCYRICHDLKVSGDFMQMEEETCAKIADKVIYYYSLEMCQNAAMYELFGKEEEAFKSYQTAHILLHSLAQEATDDEDVHLINNYKKIIEKRLFVLQKTGAVQVVSAAVR